MSSVLIEAASDETIERLRVVGVRILHRFGDSVVVSHLPDDVAADIAEAELERGRAVPGGGQPGELGRAAYRMRQTESYRRRKATARPTDGLPIDVLLSEDRD